MIKSSRILNQHSIGQVLSRCATYLLSLSRLITLCLGNGRQARRAYLETGISKDARGDAYIAPAERTNFSVICGKFISSQWVDVGIDPYEPP